MEDIAPSLLEKIRVSLIRNIERNAEIRSLNQAIQNGTATYIEAERYGICVGEALSAAFSENLSSAVLPDGKMYFNIADRVIRPLLAEDYELISTAAAEVQKALNLKAGIGIKVQTAAVDADRIDGLINSLVSADQFDDVAWMLDEPVINFSLSAVTEVLKVNFEFHGKSGLNPKIVRRCEAKACKWCRSLAGTYEYPVENRDVYRRHQRCRCTVLYNPGDGRYQNIHTKQWTASAKDTKKEIRQIYGLKVSNGTTVSSASNHALEQLASRNITADGLRDAMAHPLTVTETQFDKLGRPSFQIIGQKATLTINPQTGKVLTAYPTHKETIKMYKRAK